MKFTKILLLSILATCTVISYADTPVTPTTTLTNTAPVLPASASGTPDISGNYQCQGYDPYGKSNYTNPVRITKSGDTYGFQWLSSKGYPLLLGSGLFNRNLNNAVSVVFWDPKKAEYFGTIIYQVKADGSLDGYWTIQAENLVGTENCVKSK